MGNGEHKEESMRVVGWLLGCIGLLASLVEAPAFAALSTAFTYQGQLQQGMTPASGSCDFQFSLFDAANGGTQVGGTQSPSGVSVTSGLFTVQLDFGSNAFGDHDRWLQMAVRCPAGAGSFSTLLPRQQLTAAPNALYARAAGSATDLVCSGCVSSSDLANASIGATQLGDNVINSLKIADGTVTSADVGFNYAGSSNKGGAANDLACSNCVGTTEIIGGAAGQVLTTTGGGVAWQNPSPAGAAWSLTGNAGTNSATNFLGTTDNQALELRVNGERTLRLAPNPTSPNIVGGHSNNTIAAGIAGASILGGGRSDQPQQVDQDFGTIGGGRGNHVNGVLATVGGGGLNMASQEYATVAGGVSNTASGDSSTVAGGQSNSATSLFSTVSGGFFNQVIAAYGTIGGGGKSLSNPAIDRNQVTDEYGTIGGGGNNVAGNSDGDQTNSSWATVGGGLSNLAMGFASTISGGQANSVNNNYAAIGGGISNRAAFQAVVGGGSSNHASGNVSTVGGGALNLAVEQYTTVSGGTNNYASGNASTVGGGENNSVTSQFATVSGGYFNQVIAPYGTIGGGGKSLTDSNIDRNVVTDEYGTIGGGGGNLAGDSDGDPTDSPFATVGGGQRNTASGAFTSICGGQTNTAGGNFAAIGGGLTNTANGFFSTVAGGLSNSASEFTASVGGGSSNVASANWATVPGGFTCTAAGIASFASGTYAKANHNGTFVWADSSGLVNFESTIANEFSVRATGGVRFVSEIDGAGSPTAGVQLAAGGGSWSSLSDRAAKERVSTVDGVAVLQQLAQIPIHTWNYKSQGPSTRHMGPMAQDFYAAFQVGEDDRHITTIDADGVALAAIQGLHRIVQRKEAEISEQRQQIAALEERLQAVEAVLTRDRKPTRSSLLSASAAWWPLVGFLGLGILFRDRWSSGPH